MKFKILRPMLRVWRSKTYRSGMLGWSLGIGLVIGFSPTVGLQMLICIAICLLWNRFHEIKLNLPAMLVGSLVVNPLTMAPTYLLYYQVGCQVVECRLRLREEFFMSVDNITQIGSGILVPIVLGSVPFMLVALPIGVFLGNRIEALLERRRKRRPERRAALEKFKSGPRPPPTSNAKTQVGHLGGRP